jgi:transcriptional regulator with XRE-family HTH domain
LYFATNLKYLRESNGEQQKELAQLLDVSEPTISKYESGFVEPNLERIVDISRHYEITLDDLVLKDLRPPMPMYAKNMTYLRKKRAMSQGDIADLLGVTQKCVSKYEKSERAVDVEKLMKLADFFGVTLDQMVKQDLSKEESYGKGMDGG